MKFAMFCEIPVARPWHETSELEAPYEMRHEDLMKSIERKGKYVLPEFQE